MDNTPTFATEEQRAEQPKWIGLQEPSTYHSDRTALSQGQIKKMERSPKQFLAHWRKPYEPSAGSTPAIIMGTAYDLAVKQPAQYARRVVVAPKFSGEGMKAAKKEWLEKTIAERGADIIQLSEEDFAHCNDMAMSLIAHPVAGKIIKGEILVEVGAWWVDQETGLRCRMLADFVRADNQVWDLKSAIDASKEGFRAAVKKHDYYFQAAQYVEGALAVTGEEHLWGWLVSEKEDPYDIGVYPADESALTAARARRRLCLRKIADCISSGKWPGYNDDRAVDLDMPGYTYEAVAP